MKINSITLYSILLIIVLTFLSTFFRESKYLGVSGFFIYTFIIIISILIYMKNRNK